MANAYVDTSVFGGILDDEFDDASKAFFELVRKRRFSVLVSDITRREIAQSPVEVKTLFSDLASFMRLIPISPEVLDLRDAYIKAAIVGEKWLDDAAHVAAATVAKADLIVSWNFRHIVHFEKIRLYNEVNVRQGYVALDIRSPLEVVSYEDEEEV